MFTILILQSPDLAFLLLWFLHWSVCCEESLSYLLDSCLHVKQNSGKVLTNHPSLMNFYLCPVNIWTRDGNGKPLQYSCLQNPMDGGALWAAFHGVATSRSQLSDFTFTFHFHALVQNTSCKMLGWMKHKQKSRSRGEISITSDMQMTPLLGQKTKN